MIEVSAAISMGNSMSATGAGLRAARGSEAGLRAANGVSSPSRLQYCSGGRDTEDIDGSSALTVAGRSVTTAIAYSNNSMISSDRDCSGLGDDGSSSSSYCSNHYGADRRY